MARRRRAAPGRRELVRHRRHQRPRGARRGAGAAAVGPVAAVAAAAAVGAQRAARSTRRRERLADAPDDDARRAAGRRRLHAAGRPRRLRPSPRRGLPRRRGRRRAALGERGQRAWRVGRRTRREPVVCVPVPRPGRAVRRHGARAVSRRAVFRADVDECCAVLLAHCGPDLRGVLYRGRRRRDCGGAR